MNDGQRARVHALWDALAPPWPEQSERAGHFVAIASSLLEAGEYRTYVGLMRTIGSREASIWEKVEQVAEMRGDDPGEIFRDLFEPDMSDFSGRSDFNATGGVEE